MNENRENFIKKTGSSLNSDQKTHNVKPSTGIILVTRAAVDALTKVKDAETKDILPPNTAPPLKKFIMDSVSLDRTQSSHSSASDVVKCLNSSKQNSQIADDINSEEMKKSPLELSFNGTQRVTVPSRLLREIKSPLDRGSVTLEGDHPCRPSSIPVVSHVNGESIWMSSRVANLPERGRCPAKSLQSCGKSSRDDVMDHTDRIIEANVAKRMVREREEQQVESSDIVAADTGTSKKDFHLKGLHPGEPKLGMPLSLYTESEKPSDVTVRSFALSTKEKAVKETFLRRQEQKKPSKRLVHPTLVPSQSEHSKRELKEDTDDKDNPVVTAAAIAAAAAAAATGPFLQLQHTLETQVAALLSKLQDLQKNQNGTQHLHNRDEERKLQQQIDCRLKRLEDLQTRTSEKQPPSFVHPVNCLPTSSSHNMTSSSFPPGMSTSNHVASVERGDERPQKQYSDAGQFEPRYTIDASPDGSEDPKQVSRTKLHIAKNKIVKNTRTQTSPQESISSSESPLQTPLPRKCPPVPISRYELARSQIRRHPSESAGIVSRVNSDYGLPSCRAKQTEKEKLLSQDSTVRGHEIFPATKENNVNFHSTIDKSDVALLKSETTKVLSEVLKVKSELGDIFTKETGKLKQDLVQQQLIKGEAHSSSSPFRNAGSSPLDEYLVTSCGQDPPGNPRTELDLVPVQTTVAHHFADTEHMLKDIQHQRKNLESNLKAVERKRDQRVFYHLLDTVPFNSECDGMVKIRRNVDTKIEEITSALQREIEQDSKKTLEELDDSVPPKNKPWGIKTYLPHRATGHRDLAAGCSGVGTKAVGKKTGKENVPEKGAAKKIKAATHKTSAHMKKSSKPGLAQKQDYLSSVYGRLPYQPVRMTSKAPYLHYQSPVNPKTAAVMTGLLAGGNRVANKEVPLQDLTSVPREETTKPRKNMTCAVKKKLTSQKQPAKHEGNVHYFFQPTVDLSQIGTGEKSSTVAVPLEGQLVPMAVPLGKPKTDLTQRLPVATDVIQDKKGTQAEAPSSSGIQLPPDPVSARPAPKVPASKTSPCSNVAVITVLDKELGNHSKEKKQRKSLAQEKKRKRSLAVQVLPTVDIDSVSESSYSSTMFPHIDDIPEPVARPQDTDYQEFRNYVAVGDIETVEQTEDVDDSVDGLHTPHNLLTLEGNSGIEGHPYTGLPFPPEHPSMKPQSTEPGSLQADFRQAEALEERALEWVEQELLALIVSQMNQPVPDPTSFTRMQATPEISPLSESEDEDADRLAATIGLNGIQLFIDAGLPVDRDLVSGLIREVIEEKITTVLGHPKPTARSLPPVPPTLDEESQLAILSPKETPLSTPVPTPEYTSPESEESAQQVTLLSTPEGTPTTAVTSDESLSLEANLKNQNQEDSNDDQVQTPVVTPVPTPPGAPSSPASVATPEPSIREPESSSQSAVVPTPPPSASVKLPSSESEPEPEPKPVVESDVAEESIQHKEQSEGDKTRRPTKLVQPLVSSPSSMTTSTLSTVGTTTVTTEEELSEGELIQPLVHAGKYSEGEFAISPDIIQLAVETRLPVGGDWDSTMMGKDEESRNELVRVALNGILQRGKEERKRLEDRESSSNSSSSDSNDQISTASTLRDTDDIKQDSVADITQSEGEVRVQDPMKVFLRHIQLHLRSPGNTFSEGELLPEHLSYQRRQASLADNPRLNVTAAGDISPGEVVWGRPSTSGVPLPTPPESKAVLQSRDQATAVNQSNVPAVVAMPTVTQDISVEEEEQHSHHDRSLHASDLFPETLGTDSSRTRIHQSFAKPKVIHVEEQDSKQSDSNSLDNHVRGASPPILAIETSGKVPAISVSFSGRGNGKETSRNREPTQIQVTLPSMGDIQDTSEESQVLADIEQDSFGDVSSISGGDF